MTDIIHDPGNTTKMKEIYIFVSRDKDGNEGIVGANIGKNREMMAMVTSETKNLPAMKKVVSKIPHRTGKTIHLLKFTTREELSLVDIVIADKMPPAGVMI